MYLQKKSIWIWIVFTEGELGLYLREKLIEVFGFGFYLRVIHVFGFGFASRGFLPISAGMGKCPGPTVHAKTFWASSRGGTRIVLISLQGGMAGFFFFFFAWH